MRIIDISVPIEKGMILWPKSLVPKLKLVSEIGKGNISNETVVELGLHTGTHIDAPSHFITKGKTIRKIDLKNFIGDVFVAYILGVKEINAKILEGLRLPKGVRRLLLKTDNSKLWKNKNKVFNKDFVGLTTDGSLWLIRNKIILVGIDYLSIAKFEEVSEVHKKLLKNKIIILEGLDLSHVGSGVYQLICFPLKFMDQEASLTRAVLIR